MKYILLTIGSSVLLIILLSFNIKNETEEHTYSQAIEIPKDVQSILENKCLQCHGAEGTAKAKMKWNFEKMNDLKKSKQISKLSKLIDEVTEAKMPPKKYVKNHPESVLSSEEKSSLVTWANQQTEKLIGQ